MPQLHPHAYCLGEKIADLLRGRPPGDALALLMQAAALHCAVAATTGSEVRVIEHFAKGMRLIHRDPEAMAEIADFAAQVRRFEASPAAAHPGTGSLQ